MGKIFDHVMNETQYMDPVERCVVMAEIYRKYGIHFEIIRGYIVSEMEGVSMSCTYVWLQNGIDKIFPIYNPFDSSVLSETLMPGAVCIDNLEPEIISNISNILQNQREVKRKHYSLLNKHPLRSLK